MKLREFLDTFDFSFYLDPEGYHLVDKQGVGLGGIETETFHSVPEIVDRLSVYYHDYIYEDLRELGYKGDEDYQEMLDYCIAQNDDMFNTHIALCQCIVAPEIWLYN